MSRRRSALVLAIALSTPSVWGQARPWTAADRAAFRAAVSLVDARRYDDAAAAFRALHAQTGDARILFNLSATAEAAGDAAGALDALDRFARDAPAALLGPRAAAVAAARARLTARVGVLRVTVDAPELRVTVDGAPVATETARAGVRLNPGDHPVTLTAPRHAAREERVTLAAGEARTLDGSLVRERALLTVRCEVEGAEVRVDDRVVGETPLTAPVEVAVGARVVTVSRAGHRPFRATLSVDGDRALDAALEVAPPIAPTTAVTPLPPRAPRQAPRRDASAPWVRAGWITLGVGAAATAVGAAFFATAMGRVHEASERLTNLRDLEAQCLAGVCPRRTTLEEVRAGISDTEADRARRVNGAVFSAIGAGLGVAAMTVGVVLLVRSRPGRAGVALAPAPLGLTLRAVW